MLHNYLFFIFCIFVYFLSDQVANKYKYTYIAFRVLHEVGYNGRLNN